MSKFIAIGIAIVLTISIGVSSINGTGTNSVRGSITGLMTTSSTQVNALVKDL